MQAKLETITHKGNEINVDDHELLTCYHVQELFELTLRLISHYSGSAFVTALKEVDRTGYFEKSTIRGITSELTPGYRIAIMDGAYEIATDTFYRFDITEFNRQCKVYVRARETLRVEYHDIMKDHFWSSQRAEVGLIESCAINKLLPGLLDWLITHGCVSRPILIPRDKVIDNYH